MRRRANESAATTTVTTEPIPPPEAPAAEPSRRPALRPLTLAAVGVLVLLLAVAGVKSYRDLESVRREETVLQEKVDATRHRIDALKHRVERLRDDPATLERLAREELGMVKPEDVVFVLPAGDANPGAVTTAEAASPQGGEVAGTTPAPAQAPPAATEPPAAAEAPRSAPQE